MFFIRLYILASGEGAYSFQFADNHTVQQFLYSRTLFNEYKLHYWKSNVLRNDLNKTYLQRSNTKDNFVIQINDDFKGCIDYHKYIITTKYYEKKSIREHIKCVIVNGDEDICDWTWLKEQNEFNITLTDITSTEILGDYDKYGVGKFDVLGYLRCSIEDKKHFRYITFDLPFVVSHPNSTFHDHFAKGLIGEETPISVLTVCVSVFTIVLLILGAVIAAWKLGSIKGFGPHAKIVG